jgi:hypothetical protein
MDSMSVLTLDDWHDGALLNSRWSLETVSIDTTEKFGLQVHRVKGVCGFIVVGLDLAYWMNGLVEVRKFCLDSMKPLRRPLQVGMITGASELGVENLPSGTSSRPLESAMIAGQKSTTTRAALCDRKRVVKARGKGEASVKRRPVK